MSSINQSLSLFIPRVNSNVNTEFMVYIFENLCELGKISRIDRVKKHRRSYFSAYIHFEYWNVTTTVENFQNRVTSPEKEARIVYSDPFYWVVFENTSQRMSVEKCNFTELIEVEREKVGDLEMQLWMMHQSLIKERELTRELRKENGLLREELNKKFKLITRDDYLDTMI